MAGGREQMIDAAERLGAEQGLGAMSLREVQAEAGQRNKSAAQYHFGSRAGLIEAVVAERMGPINEARLAMLAELPTDPALRDLVEVLVVPLAGATLDRRPSYWARFLFQGWADPTVEAVVRRSFQASSYRTVRRLLVDRLSGLPDALREPRIDRAVGLVVMSLAATEAAAQSAGRSALTPAMTAAVLVDECCGLLAAPVSATTVTTLTNRPADVG